MTFATILFIGLVWMPDGSVEPPIVRPELSMEACDADGTEFILRIEQANASNVPSMRMVYAAQCHPIVSTSGGKKA